VVDDNCFYVLRAQTAIFFTGTRLETRCAVELINGTTNIWVDSATDGFRSAQWVHVGCVYDYSGDDLQSFASGDPSGTSTDTADGVTPATRFSLATNQGAADFYLDDAFVYNGALSDEDFCRVCSCGVDGSACSCDGTAWADEGRNSASCGSCTLPNTCNEATP